MAQERDFFLNLKTVLELAHERYITTLLIDVVDLVL